MAKRSRNYQSRRDTSPQHRINLLIRVPEIRLVGDNLDEVSEVAGRKIDPNIYPTRMVQEWANALELDLVEISPKAEPPVCKIIDYKKFLYNKKKKEKELKAKTSKTVVKDLCSPSSANITETTSKSLRNSKNDKYKTQFDNDLRKM